MEKIYKVKELWFGVDPRIKVGDPAQLFTYTGGNKVSVQSKDGTINTYISANHPDFFKYFEEVKPEPKPKFEKGEEVIHKLNAKYNYVNCGVGLVIEIKPCGDTFKYHLLCMQKSIGWFNESDLEIYNQPTPLEASKVEQYFEGDLVLCVDPNSFYYMKTLVVTYVHDYIFYSAIVHNSQNQGVFKKRHLRLIKRAE